jgi:predicted nucleic acid-binding protein
VTSFLLDTTLLAGYFLNRPNAVEVVDSLRPGSIVQTSILSYGEVVEHLRGKSLYTSKFGSLRELLSVFEPVYLSMEIMDNYADLRRAMRSQRQGLIGDVDTLIAASALDRGLTLVSTDRDFLRVPELPLRLHEPRTFELLEDRL